MLSNGRQIAYCNILHILSYCLRIEDFLGGACKKAPFFLNCMVAFAILQFFFIVVLLFFSFYVIEKMVIIWLLYDFSRYLRKVLSSTFCSGISSICKDY
jgi:hypothetical protein